MNTKNERIKKKPKSDVISSAEFSRDSRGFPLFTTVNEIIYKLHELVPRKSIFVDSDINVRAIKSIKNFTDRKNLSRQS